MARISMYTSPSEFEKYQNGKVAWGISEEARTIYPYMRMHLQVHASEVVKTEEQTIGQSAEYNKPVHFLSYEIRRVNGFGD